MATINFDYKNLRNSLDNFSINHRSVFDSIGSQLLGPALSSGQGLKGLNDQLLRAEKIGDQDQIASLQSNYNQQLQDSYMNFQKAMSANSPNTKQLADYVSPQLQGIDQAYSNIKNMSQDDYEKVALNGNTGGDLLMRNLDSFPGVSNQAGIVQGLKSSPNQQAPGLDLQAIQAIQDPTAQAGAILGQMGSIFQGITSQGSLLADPRFTANSGIAALQNVSQGLNGLGYTSLASQLLQNPSQAIGQLSQGSDETYNQFQTRLSSVLAQGQGK